jgi:hypothetical protein
MLMAATATASPALPELILVEIIQDRNRLARRADLQICDLRQEVPKLQAELPLPTKATATRRTPSLAPKRPNHLSQRP